MKKTILALVVIFSSVLTFAQDSIPVEENKSNIINCENHFYLKAGANMSFFSGEIAKWDGKISYNLGLGLAIPITENINLAPELNYYRLTADAGKREYWGGQEITIKDDLRISIIAIPLFLQYNINEKFQIEIGPQVNYISSVTRTRNDGKEKTKANARVNEFDFGASAGLTYFFTDHFGVNARYYLGLTEVDEYPGTYTAYTSSDLGKISFASLGLVYKF